MRYEKRFSLACFFILAFVLTLLNPVHSTARDKPEYEIKFATVAPEGSTWMRVMRALDDELREATEGVVGFKIYPGGVQGDEPDVLRKMRFGQLHAAGYTGNGLGEILPDVRVLELPFLFRNKEEIDHITGLFFDRFDAAFRERGFVLLGWTEVGSVHFFSNKPVRGADDIHGARVWSWEGDPLARALFNAFGIVPRSLPLTEVLTALQTGMIDAVYTTPLAAISLQWFTRVKYMNTYPLTNATGAVLMTKKMFDRIPPEQRDTLLEVSRRRLHELTRLSRRDNDASIEQLVRSGITLIDTPPGELAEFKAVGEQVKRKLTGELFSEEILNEVVEALERYRANNAGSE